MRDRKSPRLHFSPQFFPQDSSFPRSNLGRPQSFLRLAISCSLYLSHAISFSHLSRLWLVDQPPSHELSAASRREVPLLGALTPKNAVEFDKFPFFLLVSFLISAAPSSSMTAGKVECGFFPGRSSVSGRAFPCPSAFILFPSPRLLFEDSPVDPLSFSLLGIVLSPFQLPRLLALKWTEN